MKDYKLENRKFVIGGFLLIVLVIFGVRLFNLQIKDPKYKESALSNAFLRKITYPSRGLIYDRNGNLVVYNSPTYDVMVIPRDMGKDFDTLALASTLGITEDEFKRKWAEMKAQPSYSAYTPQKLISHLSQEDYGRLLEKIYAYPGVFIQSKSERRYNFDCGANFLGNIREVSQSELEADNYYSPGDLTGDLGVEKSYEQQLRGVKGEELLLKDVHGRIIGSFEEGVHDVSPVSGKNLTLSIDMELQKYGEELMRNKIGAIVAIEPSTGEILALVTSPNYDPSLLTGKERGNNYAKLVSDPQKPLYDRSIQGAYPPGSTFKPSQALILLQENIVNLSTSYPCSHGYVNGLRVGCHGHASPIALKPALQTSCNAYFCWGFKNLVDKKGASRDEQFTKWKDYMVSMGYGYPLGVDLPHEKRGFIPNVEFYNNSIKGKKWSANSVISISIGQGEILATPLQIANLCATIANRGYFYTPHIVRNIEGESLDPRFSEKHTPPVKKEFYDAVAEGMRMAVTGGTCRGAAIPGIEVCGKTGTAQNPHGKDHSAFIGFAPYREPKIAVVAYVENAGFGATYGVPIGSLMIEKYLNGKIDPSRTGVEARMKSANTIVSSGVKSH